LVFLVADGEGRVNRFTDFSSKLVRRFYGGLFSVKKLISSIPGCWEEKCKSIIICGSHKTLHFVPVKQFLRERALSLSVTATKPFI
jgi:hypothetical protein